MSCAACSARVEGAVSKLDGVSECTVNLLTNSMTVESDLDPAKIIDAVVKAGYKAKVVTKSSVKNATEDEKKTIKHIILRLVISAAISVPLMVIAMSMKYPYLQMVLSLAVMGVNGRFFVSGTKGLIHLSPNMDTLVSLGSLSSFIYSMALLLTGMEHKGLYFDSAAMILTLITVGKLLEAISKGHTTNAIKSLSALAPDKATVVRRGKELSVPIEEVVVGDIYLVKEGDSFPVDGRVVFGEGLVDESALTGESILVDKKVGDPVYTSTINIKGTLKCEATEVGEDTFLSKVIKMVTDASATKAPIARLADTVSGIFVPSVILVAIVTFTIWMLLGKDVGFSLGRAISVLVVSCPCALGLATPVAIMVGNGVAAKAGILFKNAAALEHASESEVVILDKTGTITKGDLINGDSLKDDSQEAIAKLKAAGLRLIMLTGDNEETALRIAKEAGIDEVVSKVLPGGKEEVVSGIMNENKKVMMVGDGVNDAVALTRADVGVAIGSGKDVAIDSADVVLMKNSLMDVIKLIRISKATLRKIKINLFFAFLYNVLLIPVAAGVFEFAGISLNPMLCALAMSLSSFIVVTNSLFISSK